MEHCCQQYRCLHGPPEPMLGGLFACPEPIRRYLMRRRVWIHRTATAICVLLAAPAVLWWKNSILFVIMLSLSTQAYASFSASEAADDRQITERLDRIEALLEREGRRERPE